MKSAIISGIILTLLFVFVGVNTAVVDSMLSDALERTEALSAEGGIAAEFAVLKSDYERHARYINLTVSHVMLLEVEEAFAEMDGAIKSESTDEIIQAKSRLTDSIEQLKRLAGLNFYSII